MTAPLNEARVSAVLAEVKAERERQHAKWGEQNWPDGTGSLRDLRDRAIAQVECEQAFTEGNGTFSHILIEEVREAFAESDPTALRRELIQVCAVACQWIEAIDRRGR